MDEFIGIDEASEMLFDKADINDSSKIKRLFQYYSRGKIDFHIELFGRSAPHGLRFYNKPKGELILADEKLPCMPQILNGVVMLPREYSGEYMRRLLSIYLYDCEYTLDESVFMLRDQGVQIDVVEDITGMVWWLKEEEPRETLNGVIFNDSGIYPQVDDLLIKAEQIVELTQSIKPQKTPHKRADITEKSNKTKMEVLGAALSVLAQFRPQCESRQGIVQGAKVAKVIEDKAGLFWPETNQAPQEPEVLRKTINEWLNKSR